jgi:signal transduction histidine kinase
MVNVLWRDGNHAAAIRVEEMFNAVVQAEPTPVLCGYAMDNFVKANDADEFRRVCDLHTEVQPAEGDARSGDAEAARREIARLQQRARALETEVRQRHELEVTLHRALDGEHVARRAKEQFLAAIGHELRNPLGSILLALDLVEQQLGDSGARELRIIRREVERLARLIDELGAASARPRQPGA